MKKRVFPIIVLVLAMVIFLPLLAMAQDSTITPPFQVPPGMTGVYALLMFFSSIIIVPLIQGLKNWLKIPDQLSILNYLVSGIICFVFTFLITIWQVKGWNINDVIIVSIILMTATNGYLAVYKTKKRLDAKPL
jgi:hypothetical protein